jgi:hypothetical protein
MLYSKIRFDNIWRNDHDDNTIHNYFYRHWNISKNKNFEIQISRWSKVDSLLDLEVDLRWKGTSHAGPSFSLEIGRYFFCIKLYDGRHWDYKRNNWTDYSEEDDSEYGVTR